MFAHVTIRVTDRAASERFYRTVLGAIAIEPTQVGGEVVEWDAFSVAQASAARAATTGLHVAFTATSRNAVDAFWRAGVEAGYADDGAPGPRPQYSASYYGGFLRDPDGNSAEAVHHGDVPLRGMIDHLWIRVADLEASTRFYERVAPRAGFELRWRAPDPERVGFATPSGSGSFSVVADSPLTRNAHVAFPAAEAQVVLDPDGNTVELVGRSTASG